ncbi:RNA-binding protein [Stenotrophomonas maltophilia]
MLAFTAQVEPRFIARTAVYARQVAHMKDMPALLLAVLSLRDPEAFAQAFPRVVDNARQLRSFVQIMRSGQVGRRSLGSLPKRLVREWIQQAPVATLVRAAIGQQPSLGDLIRMVHPKPVDAERKALYAWIVGRAYDEAQLPPLVQAYEAFKRDPRGLPPDLPFQYFSTLSLDAAQWSALAAASSWQTLRMNLNTFARNGVFDDPSMVRQIAGRLSDPQQVRRSRVLPYQLLMAYAAGEGLPQPILEALQDAMEIATASAPALTGRVVVAVDVSGSMQSPVTGYRRGASSKVRCVDVAALIAACVVRGQPQATVLPFDTEVRPVRVNPRDSVMTLARQLAINGGGTSVSAPLCWLNVQQAQVDLVVMVSDNESWRDTGTRNQTATMLQWEALEASLPAGTAGVHRPAAGGQQPDRAARGRAAHRWLQRRGVRPAGAVRASAGGWQRLGRAHRGHDVVGRQGCRQGPLGWQWGQPGRDQEFVFAVNAGGTTLVVPSGLGSSPRFLPVPGKQTFHVPCHRTASDGTGNGATVSTPAVRMPEELQPTTLQVAGSNPAHCGNAVVAQW